MKEAKRLLDLAVEAMECENWPLAVKHVTEAGKRTARVLKDLTVDDNSAIRKQAAAGLNEIADELKASEPAAR